MAARIDLDRCPTRLSHHVPGQCSRQTHLPSLRQPLGALSMMMALPTTDSVISDSIFFESAVSETVTSDSSAGGATEASGSGDTTVAAPQTSSSREAEDAYGGSGLAGEGSETSVGAAEERGGDDEGKDDGEEEPLSMVPLDRAGACGLWLRLVIVPLMAECLQGTYRSRLLALHMTQVRRMRY